MWRVSVHSTGAAASGVAAAAVPAPVQQAVNMNNYYNAAGGCFGAGSTVLVVRRHFAGEEEEEEEETAEEASNEDTRVPVHEVRAGDVLRVADGGTARVLCVALVARARGATHGSARRARDRPRAR